MSLSSFLGTACEMENPTFLLNYWHAFVDADVESRQDGCTLKGQLLRLVLVAQTNIS